MQVHALRDFGNAAFHGNGPCTWYAAVMFDEYLSRWNLIPDGCPIITTNARLLPVRYEGEPAMLKLAIAEEERVGGRLME